MTEEVLVIVVFSYENLWSYLLGIKVIMHTNYATLIFLMEEKDAKMRLIRWVILLQEFYIEVKV